MSNYDNFVALAQRQIAKRGREVTLQTLSASSADASKPWKGQVAPVISAQVVTMAVFLDPKGLAIASVVKDVELLKRVNDVALVAPGDVDLRNMTQLVDGKVLRIEWVQVLQPGDTVCLYVFGVMR